MHKPDQARLAFTLPQSTGPKTRQQERGGSPKKAAPGGFWPKKPASAFPFLPLCSR